MDANWLLVTDVAQCINMVRGHKGWFTKREAGVEAAIASLTANPCDVNIQAVRTAYQALEDKINGMRRSRNWEIDRTHQQQPPGTPSQQQLQPQPHQPRKLQTPEWASRSKTP